jgi:hypothetical protein
MRSAFLVLLLAGLMTVPSTAPGAVRTARLQVMDTAAPALRGTGFKPSEHVRLQIVAGTTHATRRVVASRSGAFTVSLAGLTTSDCAFSVVASGNEGTRTTYKRAPGVCAEP